ncbi:hypothetical protein L484_013305 [Morus notabilis]|uniref:Serpin domain-containing protein n=1 Tax=Morus notabilis TaxID=981085 RepID=W9QST5_9ROSA|nr:hypothetical protein L484_013305 [Morus notabilis]
MALPNSNHFKSDFCLLLANLVLEEEALIKASNFVASHLSLHATLSLVAAGSKGQTLQQLLFFLRSKNVYDLTLSSSWIISLASSSPDDEGGDNLSGGPLVSFVNGAWVDQVFDLKPSFEAIVKGSYKADIRTLDFVNKVSEHLSRAIGEDMTEKHSRIRDELQRTTTINAMERHKVAQTMIKDDALVSYVFSIPDDEKDEWAKACLLHGGDGERVVAGELPVPERLLCYESSN